MLFVYRKPRDSRVLHVSQDFLCIRGRIGAGTVMCEHQVELAYDAGAQGSLPRSSENCPGKRKIRAFLLFGFK